MQCELGADKEEKFFIVTNKVSEQSLERPMLKNYHKHEHYEILNINSSSKISFFIDGREYECNSNSFMLSPPGAEHQVVRSFSGIKRILISFRKEYVADFKDFCGIDVDKLFQTSVVMFSDSNLKRLKDLSNEMKKEFKHNNKSLRLRLLLALFFDILSNPDSVVEATSGMTLGERLLEYIRECHRANTGGRQICNKKYMKVNVKIPLQKTPILY